MMIRVLADGADGYRLVSADDTVVGWVRGRAIGVCGFRNEENAVSAALRAYCALSPWLERQHLDPLPALGEDPARCVHDGAHRWILVGRVPVARLPSGTPYDAGAGDHSFEIVLKGSISEGMAIHAALVVVRATHDNVDAADISWAARRNVLGASASLAPTTHLDLEAR
jgi:hypothetical protein